MTQGHKTQDASSRISMQIQVKCLTTLLYYFPKIRLTSTSGAYIDIMLGKYTLYVVGA